MGLHVPNNNSPPIPKVQLTFCCGAPKSREIQPLVVLLRSNGNNMILSRHHTILVSLLLLCFTSRGQRISYSEIEKDDYRQTNFEIIGKVRGNINIWRFINNPR